MNKAMGGEAPPAPERPKRTEVSHNEVRNGLGQITLQECIMLREKYFSQDTIEVIRGMEVPVSLKSMVQSRCEEQGILFIPIPNRFMEAKQVYKCGKLQIYFDRSILFVSQGGGSFIPMSWQEMMEIAV